MLGQVLVATFRHAACGQAREAHEMTRNQIVLIVAALVVVAAVGIAVLFLMQPRLAQGGP